MIQLLIQSHRGTGKKAGQCRRKFLHFFPRGFSDPKYIAWERGYKWQAHLNWEKQLNKTVFRSLLAAGRYAEISARAVRIETGTNLLFSFEKMALRDAVKSAAGAKRFALALHEYVYGTGSAEMRFGHFTEALAALPRKQTRVLTWPLQTVFGFLANPDEFIFLKPRVTQAAAVRYGYPFAYASKPNWETYSGLLRFAAQIKKDQHALKPTDYIDLQSFIWVCGSAEYD